jgi:hypothetical protein
MSEITHAALVNYLVVLPQVRSRGFPKEERVVAEARILRSTSHVWRATLTLKLVLLRLRSGCLPRGYLWTLCWQLDLSALICCPSLSVSSEGGIGVAVVRGLNELKTLIVVGGHEKGGDIDVKATLIRAKGVVLPTVYLLLVDNEEVLKLLVVL